MFSLAAEHQPVPPLYADGCPGLPHEDASSHTPPRGLNSDCSGLCLESSLPHSPSARQALHLRLALRICHWMYSFVQGALLVCIRQQEDLVLHDLSCQLCFSASAAIIYCVSPSCKRLWQAIILLCKMSRIKQALLINGEIAFESKIVAAFG